MLLRLLEHAVDIIFGRIPRKTPPSSLIKKTVLIAHRGVHDHRAGIFENTHEAFQRAQEIGCWGIELDIQTTSDGVFVVHHDPDLKRLWALEYTISDLSFRKLQRIAPQIPTLEEVVKRYAPSMHLFLELKESVVDAKGLLRALSPFKPIQDYHLLSLDPLFFNALDSFPRAALLLVAGHNNLVHCCDLSIEKHYGGVLGNYLLFTNKQKNKLLRAHQVVGVGMINSKNSLYREINRELHWLFTDQAIRVKAYLNTR
jgi:glycerophosphoryl diester phosphodiesterase